MHGRMEIMQKIKCGGFDRILLRCSRNGFLASRWVLYWVFFLEWELNGFFLIYFLLLLDVSVSSEILDSSLDPVDL